jgi:hypothetical protein
MAWEPNAVRGLLRTIVRPFLPLSWHGPAYWRPADLRPGAWLPFLKVVTGAVLLVVTTLVLARRRHALIAYLAATAGLLHLFYDKHMGGLRHHGFVFLAFVLACWLAEDERRATRARERDALDRLRSGLLSLLLAVHVLAAATAVWTDVRFEFSAGRRAAAFLREQGLADATIVAEPDSLAGTVIGYLDQDRVYFPRAKRWGSFVRWDAERLRPASDEEVVASVAELRREGREPIVLVLGRPLSDALAADAGLRPIGRFESEVVRKERFFLYVAGGEGGR